MVKAVSKPKKGKDISAPSAVQKIEHDVDEGTNVTFALVFFFSHAFAFLFVPCALCVFVALRVCYTRSVFACVDCRCCGAASGHFRALNFSYFFPLRA